MHDAQRTPACDRAAAWLAERCGDTLPPEASVALDAHLLDCAACRVAAAETEEGFAALVGFVDEERRHEVPRVDQVALQRVLRPRPTPRRLRLAGRVAAVLLAAIGLASLLAVDVRMGAGTLQLAFALPGAGPSTSAQPAPAPPVVGPQAGAELDRVIERRVLHLLKSSQGEGPVRQAVHKELRPHLEELAHWFVDVDRRRSADLDFLAEWLDRRRETDATTLARQIIENRERLAMTEDVQDQLLHALTPGAPDVRFEPR